MKTNISMKVVVWISRFKPVFSRGLEQDRENNKLRCKNVGRDANKSPNLCIALLRMYSWFIKFHSSPSVHSFTNSVTYYILSYIPAFIWWPFQCFSSLHLIPAGEGDFLVITFVWKISKTNKSKRKVHHNFTLTPSLALFLSFISKDNYCTCSVVHYN